MSIADDEIKVVKSFLDGIDVETAKRIVEKGDELKSLGKSEVIIDYILPHAYQILKNNDSEIKRKVNQQRLFVYAFEPFLYTSKFHEIDGKPCEKVLGKISRNSINPIWNWYKNKAMNEKSELFLIEAINAYEKKDGKKYRAFTVKFYNEALKDINEALRLDQLNNEYTDREETELEILLGKQAYLDLIDISKILSHVDIIIIFNSKLPKLIENLSGLNLDIIKQFIFRFIEIDPDNLYIPFAIVTKKLQKPAQIFRLIYGQFKLRNYDHMMESNYSVIAEHVYFEIEESILKFMANYEQHSLVNIIRENFEDIRDKVGNWKNEVRTISNDEQSKKIFDLVRKLSDIFNEELEELPGKINEVFFEEFENSVGLILHDRDKQIQFAKLNRAMLFYELSASGADIIPVNQVLNQIKPRVKYLLGDAQNLVLKYAKNFELTHVKEFKLLIDAMIRYDRAINSDQKAKLFEQNIQHVIEQRDVSTW